MPNQQLISYIQEQLRKGYDINSIKDYLLRYGYNPADIEEAVRFVYMPKNKKKPDILIFGIIALIIIIIGIILAVNIMSKPAKIEATLNINNEIMSDKIVPGSYIMFKTEITKTGSGMVELNHKLMQPDGSVIDTKTTKTASSKATQFKIPSDAMPGTYTIMTTGNFGDITDSSSITFTISDVSGPEQDEKMECPASCNDYDECTDDYCSENTSFECKHGKISPCCGNSICESREDFSTCPDDCAQEESPSEIISTDEFESLTMWERVDAIKDLAETSPISAKEQCDAIGVASHKNQCYYNIAEQSEVIEYCELITDEKILDRCMTKIAEITNNSRICDSVSVESRRDNCYMSFVQSGDYSICDKLVNKYYKESCDALAIMENIPDYSQYQVPGLE